MRIVIIGAPGSGKSTLTDGLVAADPGIQTFGVRRHFAYHLEQGTPLGRSCESYVANNSWIPDEIVAAAVQEEIRRRLGTSFILEGMPGNRRQAELLDAVLAEEDLPLDAAVHVRTPPMICLDRAVNRLVCMRCDGGSHQVVLNVEGQCARCGEPPTRRVTDAPERFTDRLRTHAGYAATLVDYYRPGRLIEISGLRPPAEMVRECRRRLAQLAGQAV